MPFFFNREYHWKGRNIKEALYINAQNPKKTVDKNSIMNLEKGLDMDPIWGVFNEEFRNIYYVKEVSVGCLMCIEFFVFYQMCLMLCYGVQDSEVVMHVHVFGSFRTMMKPG